MKPNISDSHALYAQLFAKVVAQYSSSESQEQVGSTDHGLINFSGVNPLRKRRAVFISNIDKEIMLNELQGQM